MRANSSNRNLFSHMNTLAATQRSREREFWIKKLSGDRERSHFFPDFENPGNDSCAPEAVHFKPGSKLSAALLKLCNQSDHALHMVLTAGLATLLNKFSQNNDIIIGMPIYKQESYDRLINTVVPLRIQWQDHINFKELILQVKETISQGVENQNYPVRFLWNDLNGRDTGSGYPLFDIAVLLENIHDRSCLQDIQPNVIFSFSNRRQDIDGKLEFNPLLYKKTSMERIAAHLSNILESALADMELPMSGLQLLTDEEKRKLLVEFNDTRAPFPGEKTLHQLFREQVERTPGKIACVERRPNEQAKEITYRELDNKSHRMASCLRSQGVQADSIVAVMLERSLDLMISLWGILKAGGAYLPIDTGYPNGRIRYILTDSSAGIVLTTPELSGKIGALENWRGTILHPSQVLSSPPPEREGEPENAATPETLAYVIYTSGSTGRPKGVVLDHRPAVNRLNWMQRYYPIGDQDVILQKTPYIFDVSVWELFWWGISGASLCLLEPGAEKSPETLIAAIDENKITTMHFVPSMLYAFLRYIDGFTDPKKLDSLRQVFASGEALKINHVEQFNRLLDQTNGTKLINLYGPTEAAVDVSYYNCTTIGENASIPIGKPIDNINLYILNKKLALQPVGVTGELYIAGVGLARGYLNKPERTGDAFIPDPFYGHERLYRTGDLARWEPDGNIEFLGRIDHQVKIRGFRIELGEIESRLLKHEGIKEAVVLVQGNDKENQHLYAYIVSEKEYAQDELANFLQEQLPAYMIPSYFVKIGQIPLLPNGKIDRSGFPDPSNLKFSQSYSPPRNPEEEKLTEILGQVLSVKKVGIYDNFFALGGDSISSIQVVSEAREQGLHFTTQQLFQFPSVQGLMENVRDIATRDDATPVISQLKPFDLIPAEEHSLIPEGIEDAYPLAILQAGLVFQSEITRGTAMYHDIVSITLKGRFHQDALEKAVEHLTKRHPIIRTTYDLHNFSQQVQLVHKELPNLLQVEDLSHLPKQQQQEILNAWLKKEKNRHFQWDQPGLIRFFIHILDENTYQYTFSFHDSTLDGWSFSSLNTELFQVYHSLVQDNRIPEESLVPQAYSYRDFVATEVEMIKSEEAKQYWHNVLDGSTFTGLPRWASPPPERDTPSVIIHSIPFPKNLSDEIKTLARSLNVPVKNVLMAAHCWVLGILAGTDDVLTGYEHSGRPDVKGGDKILGLFLNSLPFRLQLTDGNWTDLVRDTYNAESKFLPHRRYPMALIKKEHEREALFEVVFNFVHFWVLKGLEDVGGVEVLDMQIEATTEFVLRAEFALNAFTNDVKFNLHYHAHVFSKKQIDTISNYYTRTLQLMCSQPLSRCSREDIITEEERKQLLYEFNNTTQDFPYDRCFQQAFQSQVDRSPEAIAVEWEEKQLTYDRLNRQANRLAHALAGKGIRLEDIVAVVMDRGIPLLTAILAIFKAGGVYMPMDPKYPIGRIESLVHRSGCKMMLTSDDYIDDYTNMLNASQGDSTNNTDPPPVFTTEALIQPEEPDENIPISANPGNLTYVIYTSGSTGVPKGVMIEHQGMLNHLYSKIKDLQLTDSDIVVQNASQCFDISIWQFLVALLVGGKTLVYTNELIMDPNRFMAQCENDRVTILEVVPSYLSIMLQGLDLERREFRDIRYLMVTGEILKPELVKRWFEKYPAIPMVNAYGPTEASDDITHHIMNNAVDMERVPIGKTLHNLRIYIVDKSMQLCPVGVAGEICVAGVGVGRGYLKDKEKTDLVFMESPFAHKDDPYKRLYKTGDLGCWLHDGTIDFFGRKDDQVKIRGFRIELGEIENQLIKHDLISEAVVIAKEETKGSKYLLAYIVTKQEVDALEIKEYLSRELPDYMIPSRFIRLDKIELTPNGKVDRKKLPEPDEAQNTTGVAYTAPRNDAERKIIDIWAEVLAIESRQISIYDNFFDLGGYSLKAMEVMFKSEGQFPLIKIFQYPTPKELAENIMGDSRKEEKQLFYKLSNNHGNEELSILCLPYAAGNAIAFTPLAHALGRLSGQVALYAVELPGHDFSQPEERLESINEIALRAVEQIKQEINTPIAVWGHCSGAAPALQISKLLEEEGLDFRFLCLGARVIQPPDKKTPFRSLLQSIIKPKRRISNEQIRDWLIKVTGFTEFAGLEENESDFIIRNFRHDADSAADFLKDAYKNKKPWKLNAPIYNIIAKDDPLTNGFEKKYKNWELFSHRPELIVLEAGGHYFTKTEADNTARIVAGLWEKNMIK